MDKLKMSYLCFLVVLVGVALPTAFGKQNLLTDGDFSLGDWTLNWIDEWDGTSDPFSENIETLDYDEAEPGKAPCLRIDIAARTSAQDNGHRFYQAIPITPGKYYQWYGRWKGDLMVEGSVRRHWAEILIGFRSDADGTKLTDSDIAFKRRYDQRDGREGDIIPQEEPYMTTGEWDWTDMIVLDGNTFGYVEGTGAIAPEGATHAFFCINLGGSSSGSGDIAEGSVQIWVDDLGIMSCQVPEGETTGFDISDLNKDCRTDIVDLAIISAAWLSCNLDPVDDGPLGTCF